MSNNDKLDLDALVDWIISASPRFEATKRSVVSGTSALEKFNELGRITARSMPIEAAAEAKQPSTFTPAQPVAAPQPATVTSANADYRPALKDRSIVEALLQLHQRSREAHGIQPPKGRTTLGTKK